MSDEVDFENAKPAKLAHEYQPEKIAEFFKGDEQTAIHPKELTEEMLSKYYEMSQELDHLAKLVEMMKGDIKELGKGQETIQKGKFIAMLKPVKGRKSFDFKRYVKAKIGDITDEEMEQYSSEGDPSVRLEVRKLG